MYAGGRSGALYSSHEVGEPSSAMQVALDAEPCMPTQGLRSSRGHQAPALEHLHSTTGHLQHVYQYSTPLQEQGML